MKVFKIMRLFIMPMILLFIAVSCANTATDATGGDELPPNVTTYSANSVYLKGDFVYYKGEMYQATTRTVGKDPSIYYVSKNAPLNPWKKVTMSEVNKALTGEGTSSGNTVTGGGSSATVDIASYAADKTYLAGDIVKGSDGKYYKAMWWTTGNNPTEKSNQNGVDSNWGPWKPIEKSEAEKEIKNEVSNSTGDKGSTSGDRDTGGTSEDTTTGTGGTVTKPDDIATYEWKGSAVYTENSVCVYAGNFFRAKWWTQGDTPQAKPAVAWDTPWQKITESKFNELKSGTVPPAVQPPNNNNTTTGGSTDKPADVPNSGNSSGSSATTSGSGKGFSSIGYDWAVNQGYHTKWAYNAAPSALKAKLDAAQIFTKYGVDGTKAVATFNAALTEAQWNELFKQALNGNGLSGYYSYKNFTDALQIIGKYVYVVVRPTAGSWSQKCYVVYKNGSQANAEVRLVFVEGENFEPSASSDYTIVDYAAFGEEGSKNDKIRVIAGFLAHASHETSGSWATAPGYTPFDATKFPNATFTEDMVTGGKVANATLNGYLAWSLWFNEEVAYKNLTGAFYVDSYNKVFPPYIGADGRNASSYHGRGAFQLSWNYNYGLASAIFFGDARVLNKYPEAIVDGIEADTIRNGSATDTIRRGFNSDNWQPNGATKIEGGTMAFLSSLMFWLTPQGKKPSQQDTMILNTDDGKYNPTTTLNLAGPTSKKAKLPAASGLGKPGYGWTINIMNGGFEAGKSWSGANADAKVRRRVLHYKLFVAAMGGTIDSSEQLDTVGNHSY